MVRVYLLKASTCINNLIFSFRLRERDLIQDVRFLEDVLSLDYAETHYKYVQAPRKKYSIVFDVSAYKDFRIVLAEKENSTKNVYQINLGDFENSVSWIGRGKDGE